ncbi:MAG: DUF504 domain-containing protein [Methanomicrobiales archaeon]
MVRTSEEILLRFLHDERFDFDAVEVKYTDRGAQNDRSVVSGDRIDRVRGGYMVIRSPMGPTTIPLHRLLSIRYRGITIWELGMPSMDLDRIPP